MTDRETRVHIDKLVVVGTGLIGGSFALALRARGAVRTVVGVGRSPANLDAAIERGVIDRAATLDENWPHELADADVVLVATPVAQMPGLFASMAPALGRGTLVTDAGSTKRDVILAAREHLGGALPRFVPGHPIAGAEQSGAAAATATLFADRKVILTPVAQTDPAKLERVTRLWEACGASVVTMEAERHDRILGAISHLPHLLAYALVGELAQRRDGGDYLALAGSGFRDFTRIAASSPEMWRDIALANRDVLLAEVARYRSTLDVYVRALERGDAKALDALFSAAARARRVLKTPAEVHRADDA